GLPRWREMLTAAFEVPLPATVSPQPWLTVEGMGLFWSAIIFAGALLAQRWEREERREAARTYALGILFLAALAFGSLLAKWPVPWWPKPGNAGAVEFGFFPNRNQTANVLALAGIMSAALGFEALSRKRPAGYAWFAGVALLGMALVTAYSRAGIALFFIGTTVWVAMGLRFSASRKGATLGFAAVLVLLAGFFLFGGETMKRFQHHEGATPGDFREEIQRDACRLAAQKPWFGQGLGNFEPIFALHRTDATTQSRALHPESDWLWAAVELGWPAVALLAVALGLWLTETLPFAAGTDRHLRSAAMVCGVAFALHGLVDVSGHRAGSIWPALLLFSLARQSKRTGEERAWVAPAFRVGSLLLAALGAWWLVSARWPAKLAHFPTSATVAWLDARAERESEAVDYPAMLATANEGLRIAPLEWSFYYRRGVAHAASANGKQAAVADFDRARFLEPRSMWLCLNEGKVWLALDEPELTVEAWVEALRRAGPDAPGLFDHMLGMTAKKPAIRAGLARIAETKAELLLRYLDGSSGLEFNAAVARLRQRDPLLEALSHPQRKRLFDAWSRNGDRDELVAAAVAHPEWQVDAWLGLARHYALKQDYERAWRFVERYQPAPTLPHLESAKSLAELERAFHFHPDDFRAGLGLYDTLRRLRQNDEALATLQAVDAIPGRPAYVAYLQAVLWAEMGEWARAWETWVRYSSAAQIQ
ncbi:MAG: O-antigen ligase family protein, partial [Chthoniobacteraceae bacterium]